MPCPPRPPVPLQIPQHIRACIQQSRAYQPQNEPRVIHDITQCCIQYPTLRPRIANFRPQNTAQRLVVLQGTIPIVYKGAPYKIPVHVWVMAYHPLGPPHIFVVPTNTMVLRPRHPHVAENGFVHLPYLSQWDPLTSSLRHCIDAMRQAFSVKPPVYSRDTAVAHPHPQQKQALMRTLSARLTSALEARRRAAGHHVQKFQLQAHNIVAEENNTHTLNQQNTKQYLALAHQHKVLTAKQAILSEWLSHHPPTPSRTCIDQLTLLPTVISEQSLHAQAADAALSDALDQMDEAIDKGAMDTNTYMREVRKMARLQFFHRAMLRKIQQLLAATESHTAHHPVIPTTSPRLQRVPHAAFKTKH
ncbi:unnamed protein product [Agarophyton chilense]